MMRRAFKDAMPVMLGYFPIAITFGILAKTAGLSMINGVLMSALVYGGASQFMAISMIGAGISGVSIIFATFLMNFRHFIMGASIRAKLKTVDKKYFPIIGFFLTDETFSVASTKEDIDDSTYLITLEILCHLSWVSGTLAGYLTGMFFPPILIKAMGIALYGLFVALLIPTCKKDKLALYIALSAGGLNTLLIKMELLNSSISFALSVILVSLIAALVKERKGAEIYES